jgi:hypothetical protein
MVSKAKYLRIAARLANIFLLSVTVACLLVMAYFAYYYGWIGQRQFTSWRGPVAYYVFPAVITVLLFATLRLRPDYRTVIAICCLAVAASAYGVELFLEVSDAPVSVRRIMSIPSQERKNMAAKFSRRFGSDIDIRERHEVIADLRKQGIEAVPQVVLPVRVGKKTGQQEIEHRYSRCRNHASWWNCQ